MHLGMEPRIELLRPLNSSMGAVAVAVGALVAAGSPALGPHHIGSVVVAMLVAFLYTGAGNALNDYYDRSTDRVNHPRRPIPSKRIAPESARRFSVAVFAAGMIAAIFIGYPDINWLTLGLAALNSFLLAAYEMRLKARGFPGNLVVSWLTASLFLFGGAAAAPGPGPTIFPAAVLALALLAFLSSVGREIIKGIQDVKGDRDRRTVARITGVRTAAILAGIWICLAVALSPLPVLPLNIFPARYYLPVVLLADAMFIYSVWVVFQKPGTASNAAKLAMLLALVAFLLGALTVR